MGFPYCRRVCIEHDFDKGFKIRTNTGREASVVGIRNKLRSYAAAEKGDEGMALKILARAEDMADGRDNLESHAHTKWKRAILLDRLDHLVPFGNLAQFHCIHNGERRPEVFVHSGLLEHGLKAFSTVSFDEFYS